ncbi:hypothetical protein [Actinotalea sp.]
MSVELLEMICRDLAALHALGADECCVEDGQRWPCHTATYLPMPFLRSAS